MALSKMAGTGVLCGMLSANQHTLMSLLLPIVLD